jgi:valyl-tRNA synthetase
MINRSLFSAAAAVAASVIVVVGVVAAQPERKPATLDDLLTEVRGLRADLGQTASASMRMQLLTARLTLQEQRIAVLSNQRADLLTRLAVAVRERVEMETRVKSIQDSMEEVGDVQTRAEAAAALKAEAPKLSQRLQAEQQLRLQETDLTAIITAEQGRWQEFNARLDELERSITTGSPR